MLSRVRSFFPFRFVSGRGSSRSKSVLVGTGRSFGVEEGVSFRLDGTRIPMDTPRKTKDWIEEEAEDIHQGRPSFFTFSLEHRGALHFYQ